MAKKTYSEKLKDPRWQKQRLEVFERDQFTCQYCESTTKTLNVHHVEYQQGCEPWEYDLDMLVTLCEECHEKEEFLKNFTQSGINYLVSIGMLRLHIADIISTISHRTDDLQGRELREYLNSLRTIIKEA